MKHFLAVSPAVVYYRNLHLSSVIKALRFRYKGKAIIYALRCQITGQMYIGSSLAPSLRFHSHLVTGLYSNANLQNAIDKNGLNRFTAYIFEEVVIPKGLTLPQAKAYLAKIEQSYIDRYPSDQLYNTNKSSLSS